MIDIRVRTNGQGVRVGYSRLRTHPTLKCEMAHLDLHIGDAEISVVFETWAEMIEFCERHNFDYLDERDDVGAPQTVVAGG